jgi:protein O-mannosyl-transferase
VSTLARHRGWLALVVLAVVFYMPAVRAGAIWDDGVVVANPLVADPAGLPRLWLQPAQNVQEPHYWPLVYTMFWLEYRLWGPNPVGYHTVNILLHAACVLLLWRLLARLDVPHAWLGAALFAVHPVHVESVAWMAERKDVLSGALYLGAAIAYLEFDRTRRSRSYLLALGLFTLAMLSKSIVVTLPVSLALVLWWKKKTLGARDLWALAPFVLVGAGLTAFDLALFYDMSESSHLTLTWAQRVQLAGRALWYYTYKLAWPHPLVSLYPKWRLDPSSVAGWLPLAALMAIAALLWWQRRRLGRGPLAAATYYVVTLAPALGLVQHGFMAFAWVADRFQYLPSIGPLALLGAGLGRFRAGPTLLLVLGALTWRQSMLYADHVTLFRHNVAAYPEAWQARAQLSGGLAREGKHAEAVDQLAEVLRYDPDERHTIHLELASMQTNLGRYADARENIEAALELVPDYAEAHYEYGRWMEKHGQLDEAAERYRRALTLRPDFPQAEDALRALLTGLPLSGRH